MELIITFVKTEEIKMKKLVTVMIVGAALSLTACEATKDQGGRDISSAEHQAPYASERTVGDYVFEESQRK